MSEMSVRCECCGYARDCRGCLQDENVRLAAELEELRGQLEGCRSGVGFQSWGTIIKNLTSMQECLPTEEDVSARTVDCAEEGWEETIRCLKDLAGWLSSVGQKLHRQGVAQRQTSRTNSRKWAKFLKTEEGFF